MERRVCISLNDVITELSDYGTVVGFDTETTSLNYMQLEIEGISFCDGKKSCYIPFMYRKNRQLYWRNQQKHDILAYLRGWFQKVKLLIAHNIAFDLKVLHKYDIPYRHCEYFCTLVAHHLLNESSRHGLKVLSEEYLDVKSTQYQDAAEDTGTKQFFLYAIQDAEWTWRLANIFKKKLNDEEMTELFRLVEMPFQNCLVEMEINGMPFDISINENLKLMVSEEKEKTRDEMLGYLGFKETQQTLSGSSNIVTDINLSSGDHLRKILFDKLGLDIVEQTPSGKPSVGKLTLERHKNHEFVKMLRKYKVCDKLLSSFFEPLPDFVDNDERIRPSFKDTGTVTGRLSCSKPNLQQLPKMSKDFPVPTRSCFKCKNGYKMIACDYSGQELRILAHLSKDKEMIESFENSKDLHLMTANASFSLGIPDEELYTTHPKFEEHKERFKDERNKAKIINFGYAYGKRAFGFSKDFGVDEEEAEVFVKRFEELYPGIAESFKKTMQDVNHSGEVCTMAGRKRRFKKIKKDDWEGYPKSAYREAFNFTIQGYAADMMRMAMIRTDNLKYKHTHWGLKLIATVHDEAVYEVKEQYAEEAKETIIKEFEKAVELCVPVVAEASIGNSYQEVK